MNTLTQAQIDQLTPEQRQTVAALEVGRLKEEQRLRKQARNYWGRRWLPGLAMGVLCLGAYFSTAKLVPFVMAWALWLLIEFHAAGINRRLDALIDLREADDKKGKENGD